MNPYEHWLGIQNPGRSPNYFQILGISHQETDVSVIKAAAMGQLAKLKPHKEGKNAAVCLQLENRVRKAYKVLTNQNLRNDYVQRLKGQTATSSKASVTPTVNPTPTQRAATPAQAAAPLARPAARPAGKVVQPEPASSGINKWVIIGAAALGGLLLMLAGLIGGMMLMGGDAPRVANKQPENKSGQATRSADQPPPIAKSNETSIESTSDPIDPFETVDADEATKTENESSTLGSDSNEPATNVASLGSNSPEPKPMEVATGSGSSETSPDSTAGTAEPPAGAETSQPNLDEEPQPSAPTPDAPVERNPVSGSDLAGQGDGETWAVAAHAILKANCGNCHGDNGADEGGFDFATDRPKLVASGYVRPKDPNNSLLLERMLSADSPMPPEGEEPRPSDEDIEVIRKWIRGGAQPFSESTRQKFVSSDRLLELVVADLGKVDNREREYIRYFTVGHLANAGYSKEEMSVYHKALAKLLNSLSWNRQLARLSPIQGDSSTFRIDLRELKWSANTWKTILAQYDYAIVSGSKNAIKLQAQTGSELAIVRGDWFVAHASRPPLYHDLLQLPNNDIKLESMLQVDVEKNIEEETVLRAGFARSGVSQNNRMIERHDSIFGAYWKSYDFAGNTGRKNLFENPIGPGKSLTDFEHDGGEIIFNLPNGMLAYMLVDAFGRRIDKGPTEIVTDPRQADKAVVNGVSCMSCHYGGFIPKEDEIRSHVLANKSAYKRADDILSLYLESSKLNKLIKQDTEEYLKRLSSEEIAIPRPTRAGEPVVLIANRFENEVDLNLAAAELWLEPEDFKKRLERIATPELARRVGALKTNGGVVKRDAFDSAFFDLATEMGVGQRSVASANTRRVEKNKSNIITGFNSNGRKAAEESLTAGRTAAAKRKWENAISHFDEAIRLAPDKEFRILVYENALTSYEMQSSTIKPLMTAHQYLLESANGRGTGAVRTAHNRFWDSVQRYASKRGWHWRSTGSSTEFLRMNNHELPTSTVTVIESALVARLEEEPSHEPILRVLLTFYRDVRNDKTKLNPILFKLAEIYEERGEEPDYYFRSELIEGYRQSGDFEKAALLTQQMNRNSTSAYAFHIEAELWFNAGKAKESESCLRKAENVLKKDSSASRTAVKIGDLYIRLEKPDKAVSIYKKALQWNTSSYDTKKIQASLETALRLSRGDGDGDGNTESAMAGEGDSEVNKLLDPRRQYREKATEAEKRAMSMSRSADTSYITAAENWILAEENSKALAALKKAERTMSSSSQKHRGFTKIAQLFLQIKDNKRAYENFVSALKTARSDSEISAMSAQIRAIIEEDDSIKVSKEVEKLVDPSYKYRALARIEEEKKSYSPSSEVGNLTKAMEYWAEAGDRDEVARCGKKAESALARASREKTSSYLAARNYEKIAALYEKSGLNEQAVEQYVVAVKFARDDEAAAKYFNIAKEISERENLPLHELSAQVAKRLDPLNRFRVEAQKYEQQASDSPRSSARNYTRAAESWLEAEENALASKAAQKASKAIMADKEDTLFSSNCADLAEIFEKANDKENAIKHYRAVIDASKRDYQKKDAQVAIDRLSNE